MTIPPSVRELIAAAPLIHLTTLNRDGSPQVSVIWMGIEEDEFVSGHLHLHQKLKNVRRDPRVSILPVSCSSGQ
jgi:predicted pyridoxine 5'-phosphate oxidase superfamily flavin-nucleotide-binding protein